MNPSRPTASDEPPSPAAPGPVGGAQPPEPAGTPAPAHVPGSTRSAGAGHDEASGRHFPCDGCGADLTFHIGAQSMSCEHCGSTKALDLPEGRPVAEQDLEEMLRRIAGMRASGKERQAGDQEVRCASCGGTTTFSGTITSTECPWCGTPIQRKNIHEAADRVPVDGVLPFQIERASAARNLKAWVASRWFAPNLFLRRGVTGTFNGVYLPFWTFDAMTATRFTGMRGDHYYVTVGSGKRSRRERRTRWSPAAGSFQRFFDDVLVSAATGLPFRLLGRLEPWPLERCRPFDPALLSGYLARTYDITLDRGFAEDGKARIEAALTADVRSRIGGDEQRITSMETAWSALTYKHLLLPVWLLAYRFKGKSYQVAVNAATGEVQGERPWSWVKIGLAILAGLVAAFVFSQLAD